MMILVFWNVTRWQWVDWVPTFRINVSPFVCQGSRSVDAASHARQAGSAITPL